MRVVPQNHLISAQFSQNIVDLRNSISKTSEEAVTGRQADLAAHLSGRVGIAMLSQKAVEDIAIQREQLGLRATRLEVAQRSLTLIHERTVGLDTRMLEAIGMGNVARQSLAARDSEAALKDIFSSLNVRFGERYLFAGDATSTQPLTSADDLLLDIRQLADAAPDAASFTAALDTYFDTPGGGWQPDIFAGSTTSSDPDAVTANDPALVGLIRNLAIMALSDPDGGSAFLQQETGVVRTAAGQVSVGLTALTNVRADRGTIEEAINVKMQSLDVEETIFTKALNDLTARDQYEAASALKELESSLEASYLLTTRLSALSLLNFLR